MTVSQISDIQQMSIPDRIRLVEELWDSIRGHESEIVVPPDHKREIRRRIEAYPSHSKDWVSFEDGKRLLRKKK